MPNWVVDKIAAALNDRSKSLKGSRILALGIAYKRDVDDMRESPSVQVMEILRDRGAPSNTPIYKCRVSQDARAPFRAEFGRSDRRDGLRRSIASSCSTDHSDFRMISSSSMRS